MEIEVPLSIRRGIKFGSSSRSILETHESGHTYILNICIYVYMYKKSDILRF